MKTQAVRHLYSRRLAEYAAFIRFFQSRSGLRRVFEKALPHRAGLAILDAGCGFGTATFAALDLLEGRGLRPGRIDALDLTPAMLSRFREELNGRFTVAARLREADILSADALPSSWQGYDLVLCTSMLEYLPRRELAGVLARLGERMNPGGNPGDDHAQDARDEGARRMAVGSAPLCQRRTDRSIRPRRLSGTEVRSLSLPLRLAEPRELDRCCFRSKMPI